jgi:uncharacterized membrane protein YfcA
MALIASAVFIVGGFIGSKFALKIDEVILKKIFGVLMLVVAIKLLFFSK